MANKIGLHTDSAMEPFIMQSASEGHAHELRFVVVSSPYC